jgi:murein DD-endopeptidase MepM/ murein hydrolase activator NlpD
MPRSLSSSHRTPRAVTRRRGAHPAGQRRLVPRLRTLAALLAPVALAVGLGSGSAGAASIGALQQQISVGQGRVSNLSGAVGATSSHLSQLDSSIAALQQRISAIQTELDAHRAQLIKLEQELSAAKTRLARLEAFEAHAESVLSQQLINSYESGQPDLVGVVLESSGFQDLLEKLSFDQRIQKQDAQVVGRVRAARKAVAAEAVRLGGLEVRERAITTTILNERNTLVASQTTLLRQRIAVAQIRGREEGQLANARGQVSSLQHQLAQEQAAQAAQAARAAQAAQAAAAATPAATPAPAPTTSAPASSPPASAPSSGGFVFPLPKSAASPPGTWSPDQGVDISAPGDTPEYAVCSGTIVLHGIGGFGPWAPVLHCDSSIDGYDYVYYGHAGPEYQLPVGTHVGAGQVMSSIGPGIVGISTGPHLEIGFADSSGSPVGAQSAGTMLSLLQASY